MVMVTQEDSFPSSLFVEDSKAEAYNSPSACGVKSAVHGCPAEPSVIEVIVVM